MVINNKTCIKNKNDCVVFTPENNYFMNVKVTIKIIMQKCLMLSILRTLTHHCVQCN